MEQQLKQLQEENSSLLIKHGKIEDLVIKISREILQNKSEKQAKEFAEKLFGPKLEWV